MKTISNDDIIRAARQLRNEENERLHVRPWQKNYNRWMPYVSIPAACLVGFALGFSLRTPSNSAGSGNTALIDSFVLHEVVHDTIYQTVPSPQYRVLAEKTANADEEQGVSVFHDGIRYDLLAKK